jgi:hypothetical protein
MSRNGTNANKPSTLMFVEAEGDRVPRQDEKKRLRVKRNTYMMQSCRVDEETETDGETPIVLHFMYIFWTIKATAIEESYG